MTSKAELRTEARRRLRSVPPEERASLGDRIAATVWELPRAADARVMLIYASLADEVPTDGIAEEARRRGIEVVYPRCLVPESRMSLHSVGSPADLVEGGFFGIREPAPHCPAIEITAIDLALVPGLGWDRRGNRLGRGAGFYDRLFADPDWRALRCGLFFAIQEFPSIPPDPWDSLLDAVVTEMAIMTFAR